MDLAEQFESVDLAMIESFVESRQQEGLQLDFVVLSDPCFSKNDRRNLAKALSGFANSAGGLLIWGVVASRDSDGVDAASDRRPIEGVRRAHSRLESLTGECVNPVVDGVRHKRVPDGNAQGYLVSYVPESDAGPHMAKCHIDHYYKRSGDSFYRMEHFDIADMFGRRRKARLSLYVDIRRGGTMSGGGGTTYDVDIILGIKNSGRGMARFPRIELDVQPPYALYRYGLDGNGNTGLPRLLTSGGPGSPATFAGDASSVIHVDSVLQITKVQVQVPESPNELVRDVALRYRVDAEDVATVKGNLIVRGIDIVTAIPRRT